MSMPMTKEPGFLALKIATYSAMVCGLTGFAPIVVALRFGLPVETPAILLLAIGILLWVGTGFYARHLDKLWEQENKSPKGAATVSVEPAPSPTALAKEEFVRLIEERREKREAVLASALEPHLKHAQLDEIDEQCSPKINEIYSKL